MVFLDLESQLTFYKAYHNNKINVYIHMIFVPLIAATVLFALTNTPALFYIGNFPINGAFGLTTYYLITYILMEPVAGFSLFPVLYTGIYYLHKLNLQYGMQGNKVAGVLFVVSWIFQFLGHGAFEGRAPALLDSFTQAFLLAPFFVWFELLFKFGYRPELQKRLEERTEKVLKKEEEKKAKKLAAKQANGNGVAKKAQ